MRFPIYLRLFLFFIHSTALKLCLPAVAFSTKMSVYSLKDQGLKLVHQKFQCCCLAQSAISSSDIAKQSRNLRSIIVFLKNNRFTPCTSINKVFREKFY